jgi:hypothetical protein
MDPLSDPSVWYSIVCAGLVIFIILCFITSIAFRWLTSRVTSAILKYLVYSTISLFKLPNWRFSVKDLLFPVLYLTANGVCMGWDVRAAEELSDRCASLFVTNLVLLLPGTSVAADVLHISLRTYHLLHSIIGLVAVFQGLVHAGQKLAAVGGTRDIGAVSGIAVSVVELGLRRGLTLSDCWMPRTGERCFSTHLPSPPIRDLPVNSLWLLHVYMRITMAPCPQSE